MPQKCIAEVISKVSLLWKSIQDMERFEWKPWSIGSNFQVQAGFCPQVTSSALIDLFAVSVISFRFNMHYINGTYWQYTIV